MLLPRRHSLKSSVLVCHLSVRWVCTIFLFGLVIAACPKANKPSTKAQAASDASYAPIREGIGGVRDFGGAVSVVTPLPPQVANLSQKEAVVVLQPVWATKVPESDVPVWVELRPFDASRNSPPVQVGSLGQELGIGPGRYRAHLRFEIEPFVHETGWIVFDVAPAQRLALSVGFTHTHGYLYVDTASRRGGVVEWRLAQQKHPKTLAGRTNAGPLERFEEWRDASRGIAVGPGEYLVVGRSSDGTESVPQNVTVSTSEDYEVRIQLPSAHTRVRLQVTTPNGEDVTSRLDVRWRCAGGKPTLHANGTEWLLLPGMCRLEYTGQYNALVVLHGAEAIRVEATPSVQVIDVRVAWDVGLVKLTTDSSVPCNATWSREGKQGALQTNAYHAIPAGVWAVELQCGTQRRIIEGIHVMAGQRIDRALRIDI